MSYAKAYFTQHRGLSSYLKICGHGLKCKVYNCKTSRKKYWRKFSGSLGRQRVFTLDTNSTIHKGKIGIL